MKFIRVTLLAGLLVAGLRAGENPPALNLTEPLPTLVLGDGRTLRDVKITGFAATAVMAKWEGGRGTIPYEDLPADVRQAAEQKRPAPAAAAPVSSRTGLGAEARADSPLTLARHGFVTHLLRKESVKQPPEPPPAGVLDLVAYPGPLGPMAAYVTPPPADGRRHPAIIWLIGGFSNSIGSTSWRPGPPDNDQSASGFRAAGIVMMYPSLRGGNTNPGFRETFLGEVDDVIAAAQALATLDYVDPRRIYLGGHSTGGTLALLVAESSTQFRAVYALGPVGDTLGYSKEVLPFDLTDPREAQLRAPVLWLDAIKTPTFVFEGTVAPSNLQALLDMQQRNHNPLVKFQPLPGFTHFSLIGPMVHKLAEIIAQDTGN